MILINKKRGETPLQALNRLRVEQPMLLDENLSYAGRLDPMAEGILPVLIGEENKNRKDFLSHDKEYEAHFLLGCSTDTHDVLGIMNQCNFNQIVETEIIKAVENLKNITVQTYPWYSSRTVDGIPLFEHARAGRFDVVRPIREVKIYSVSSINIYTYDGAKLVEENITDIQKVDGDFRQAESVDSWKELSIKIPQQVQLVSCILNVSSGTYIRSMTEILEKDLGVPILLQKLIRTRVF